MVRIYGIEGRLRLKRRRNETTDSLDARLPEDLLRLVSPRVVISIKGVVSSFRLGCCTGGDGDSDSDSNGTLLSG